MSSDADHSPLPWRTLTGRALANHRISNGPNPIELPILSGDDSPVGSTSPYCGENGGKNLPLQEKNAALIIRAVNNHAEMIDLLEGARHFLSKVPHGSYGAMIECWLRVARETLGKVQV